MTTEDNGTVEAQERLAKGWVEVDTMRLVSAHWNYKRDDERTAEIEAKLEANIKRNGVIENILIRELDTGFYEVVNGNHRLKVIARLGIPKVMAFNLGSISLAQAERVALETNETKFPVDDVRLAKVLKDLTGEFTIEDIVSTVNKTAQEVDDLLKLNDFSWESMGNDPTTSTGEIGEHSEPGSDDFETVTLRLPEGVASQLKDQISRFKKLLYPAMKPEEVSEVLPVEAMVQVLAQTSDEQIGLGH